MAVKENTQRKTPAGLYELTDSARESLSQNAYYNEDLAPTKLGQRTWNTYHIAALWIGMSVCLPTYMMASSGMSLGLSWWQSLLNILIGNLIVLIPMQLNSHAGTKYGIPFPVFARLSFGIRGAHLAAIARAIVAAGWFGIQCWIGGAAINTIISAFSASWAAWAGGQWASFFLFWGISTFVAWSGPDAIKFMESWGAPILGILSVALMIWAVAAVKNVNGSISQIFNQPATYAPGTFWKIFLPVLTANIGFWATLALNIPDFSRYAKSQKDQLTGQLIGLPPSMAAFAFVGVFVTGACVVAFGEAIWDPSLVIARIDNPIAAVLGALGIAIATMTTNIAANVVAPANGISNISPKRISYRTGALITGLAGVAIMPWRLLSSASGYIFNWLGTYALFLGPLAGIYIADYYIYRKKTIDLYDLFSGTGGRYWYKNGFNLRAICVWIITCIPAVLGKFIPALSFFADNGWVVGFVLAIVLYPLFMKNQSETLLTESEEKTITQEA
ncbi:MAG: NCS1 family nucleobase:cation symporter-1 [Spirochaetales bacterium]|jgi:NCS1 family nucleobase:cation symporter-1|nr:NCS1 family nucleobase:cation symporter-1 [Spirochaetales bacterium]